MELEYKWVLVDEKQANVILNDPFICNKIIYSNKLKMNAIYYDTEDRIIESMHGALRLRKENATSICCMKLNTVSSEGYKLRNEYEVEANTIKEGIKLLSAVGALQEVCTKLMCTNLNEICRIEFERCKYEICFITPSRSCNVELSIDKGYSMNKKNKVPISEIEFEFLDGDKEYFHILARRIQKKFALKNQELSKIGRVLILEGE